MAVDRNREDPAKAAAGVSEAPQRDKPWIFRTYAGHSTAAASNALYRTNLARGQTGLSVAFDLPTQTGYDPDHPLAKGEVGKVGVPIAHLGDMRALFEGIPLDRMNTSMTINATAPWLLALYVACAEERGIARGALSGTTQNDILKEYLARGTHIFPPKPSLRLTTDVIAFAYAERAEMEPGQRLLLPPAGGRRDPGAGAGLRARQRHRGAGRGAGFGPGAGRGFPARGRTHLLLRQRRRALHHRGLQDARLRRALGRGLPGPLRRRGGKVPPLPLRRAGEFPGAHRAAAGEQRLPHLARDAGRGAGQGRPRPRGAASRLERGAGPAPALGPAVVAQAPADRRLRDRPARISGHIRGLDRDRGQGRGIDGRGERGTRPDRGHGRRGLPPSRAPT